MESKLGKIGTPALSLFAGGAIWELLRGDNAKKIFELAPQIGAPALALIVVYLLYQLEQERGRTEELTATLLQITRDVALARSAKD